MICLIIISLIAKIVYLDLVQQAFLRTAGNSRSFRVIDIPAFRGIIFDRNGHPLAVSVAVYSIWVNPQHFSPGANAWQALSQLLGLKLQRMQQHVLRYKQQGREFCYLRRGLDAKTVTAIKKLNIAGLYWQSEQKRYYPEAEVTSQLLGFANVDDHGQEGVELWFDKWLQGTPGKKMVVRDRLGNVIADVRDVKVPHPGNHLVLSIDTRMQYVAYRELERGVSINQAVSGTAIVLNVLTGEILAITNYPAFDPNHRNAATKNLRNNAVTDLFEPGSTIKAFSLATALASKKFTPHSLIDTSPGWLRVGQNVVKDAKNYGTLTLTQILQVSSNVGTAKAILSLPAQSLWSLLQNVGFGEATGIEFPGEKLGLLNQSAQNSPFMLATLSFGYGMAATALQLARAYAVFANDGVKLPLTLLRRYQPPPGERVMPSLLAQQMLVLLESVVNKGGTGQLARVAGYRVAGKTGTVRVVGAHGYDRKRHDSIFIGIAPVSKPLLLSLVVIHDSKLSNASGGSIAAPVFSAIMSAALSIMNIAPDLD
jgi:cell division protein FtsI (penicillin-binding protein 3)